MYFRTLLVLASVLFANTVHAIPTFINGLTIPGNTGDQFGTSVNDGRVGNDHEFLVLERNNRGIGVGASLNTADKRVYKIDITGATDVSAIDLDAPGAVYNKVIKASTVFISISANALAALGNKSPEKWEGLTIGPRLLDGSFIIVVGTDNDYSVTQNASNTQFDVYFRFSDADPFAAAIQCPLGQVIGCFTTANPAVAATLTSDYALLPRVLQAYKVSVDDLAGYIAPAAAVPESHAWVMFLAGLGVLRTARGRAERVEPPAQTTNASSAEHVRDR